MATDVAIEYLASKFYRIFGIQILRVNSIIEYQTKGVKSNKNDEKTYLSLLHDVNDAIDLHVHVDGVKDSGGFVHAALLVVVGRNITSVCRNKSKKNITELKKTKYRHKTNTMD